MHVTDDEDVTYARACEIAEKITSEVEGETFYVGMGALAIVFALMAAQVDTSLSDDLYVFGEMVRDEVAEMGEDDDGSGDYEEVTVQ